MLRLDKQGLIYALKGFYLRYNPDNAKNAFEIASTYMDDQEELNHRLQAKYGEDLENYTFEAHASNTSSSLHRDTREQVANLIYISSSPVKNESQIHRYVELSPEILLFLPHPHRVTH